MLDTFRRCIVFTSKAGSHNSDICLIQSLLSSDVQDSKEETSSVTVACRLIHCYRKDITCMDATTSDMPGHNSLYHVTSGFGYIFAIFALKARVNLL